MNKEFDKRNFNKAHGYDSVIIKNDVEYLIQYAIKKKNELYMAYFFSVEYEKMSCFEDYAQEDIKYFADIQDAKKYLILVGADLSKFSVFKGNSPI